MVNVTIYSIHGSYGIYVYIYICICIIHIYIYNNAMNGGTPPSGEFQQSGRHPAFFDSGFLFRDICCFGRCVPLHKSTIMTVAAVIECMNYPLLSKSGIETVPFLHDWPCWKIGIFHYIPLLVWITKPQFFFQQEGTDDTWRHLYISCDNIAAVSSGRPRLMPACSCWACSILPGTPQIWVCKCSKLHFPRQQCDRLGANPPCGQIMTNPSAFTHCQICFSHFLTSHRVELCLLTAQEKWHEQLEKWSKYAELLRLVCLMVWKKH